MKHSQKVTFILLGLFLLAQFIGIGVIYNYIDFENSGDVLEFKDLPIGERPPIEESTSYIPIIIAILLGTGLALLIIKYNLNWLWKIWFFLAVFAALSISFNAFTPTLVAFILAFVLAVWKIFKPNFLVHTFTEMFIYGGLAAIFVPMFNLMSMSILLVLIMIYDAYAVWKSKHMIKLAKAQTKSKLFAGLLVPYKFGSIKKKGKGVPIKVKTAILGGGDVGFPLIFAGVVLKQMGLWQSLVIPFFAAAGLGLLLYYGDEKKFYPAMPFIGVGCFLGLLVVWTISFL